MKYIITFIIFTLSLFSKDGAYIGLGIYQDMINTKSIQKDKMLGITLKGGYDLNRFLGIELRAGKSFMYEDKLKLKSFLGAYVKPMLPVYKSISSYGLLGVAQTKVATTTYNREASETDFSFGLGFDYEARPNISLYIDALQLCDKKQEYGELKARQVGMGIAYHFKNATEQKLQELIEIDNLPKVPHKKIIMVKAIKFINEVIVFDDMKVKAVR